MLDSVVSIVTATDKIVSLRDCDEYVRKNSAVWLYPTQPGVCSAAPHSSTRWVQLPAHGYGGCFVPEGELSDWRARLKRQEPPRRYEQHLARITASMGGTEVNLQTGRFTTHSNQMVRGARLAVVVCQPNNNCCLQVLLPDEAGTHPDFVEAFGKRVTGASRARAIQLSRTMQRTWLQLIGHHHDIQLWTEPDARSARRAHSRSLRSLVNGKDDWVLNGALLRACLCALTRCWAALKPYLMQHGVLAGVKLSCEKDVSNGQVGKSQTRRARAPTFFFCRRCCADTLAIWSKA